MVEVNLSVLKELGFLQDMLCRCVMIRMLHAESFSATSTMGYKNLEVKREYQRKWVAKNRADFFDKKVCVECGSPKKLELDHIDPELKISSKIWSWSLTRRESELKKCQILCTNCHKKKTSQYRKRNMKHGTLGMYKATKCRCADCRLANAHYESKRRDRTAVL